MGWQYAVWLWNLFLLDFKLYIRWWQTYKYITRTTYIYKYIWVSISWYCWCSCRFTLSSTCRVNAYWKWRWDIIEVLEEIFTRVHVNRQPLDPVSVKVGFTSPSVDNKQFCRLLAPPGQDVLDNLTSHAPSYLRRKTETKRILKPFGQNR